MDTPKTQTTRPCTCHPDDRPPVPCAEKYAYRDCVAASQAAKSKRRHVADELVRLMIPMDNIATGYGDLGVFLYNNYEIILDALEGRREQN